MVSYQANASEIQTVVCGIRIARSNHVRTNQIDLKIIFKD